MKIKYTVLSVSILFIFSSCTHNSSNSFAIRDFNKSLQPYLNRVVSGAIVGFDTSTLYIQTHASDDELKKMGQSEHPLLRAIAFRAMLERPTFNHFDLMMNNLNDTAIVATDAGEWGIRYLRVFDDMLENGRWKDIASKKKTIDEIILHHNFLSSAYYQLKGIEPKEIYYSSIKEMAQHERRNITDNFKETENALYALAKYKKSEDIPFIKKFLLSHLSQLTETSFQLMQKCPNEDYLDIYENFYPRFFYLEICQHTFTDNPKNFINSIAIYKNERSEKILSSILNRSPFLPCDVDTSDLKEELIYSIWNNPCKAYSGLKKQIEASYRKYEDENKKNPGFKLNPPDLVKDTSKEPVKWW